MECVWWIDKSEGMHHLIGVPRPVEGYSPCVFKSPFNDNLWVACYGKMGGRYKHWRTARKAVEAAVAALREEEVR